MNAQKMFSTLHKLNPNHLSLGCTTLSRCSRLTCMKLNNISSSHSSQNICDRGGGGVQLPITSNIVSSTTNHVRCIGSAANTDVSYLAGSFIGDLRRGAKMFMIKGVVTKNLYESCSDEMDYITFFETCSMEDNFQSWYSLMNLHVWMVLIRLRSEGRPGKKMSYLMVELMWKNLEEKLKIIGVVDTSARRETVDEYTQQFFGGIVAYDEGLLGDDQVLASALWRNLFYRRADADVQSLALMVDYVRRQIQHLEQQSSDSFLLDGTIKWLPLHENENPVETTSDVSDSGQV